MELASLYTVWLSAINGFRHLTTMSNGQAWLNRKFLNRLITFESNLMRTASLNSNRIVKLHRYLHHGLRAWFFYRSLLVTKIILGVNQKLTIAKTLNIKPSYPESCVSRRSYANTLVRTMTMLNWHETIQSIIRLTNWHCLPCSYNHTSMIAISRITTQ